MRKIITVIMAVILVLVPGCAFTENVPESEDTANEYTPDINPVAEAASDSQDIVLYFRYGNAYLLAAEKRTVDVPVNERLESVVLKALIAGPSNDIEELTEVIDPGTRLVDVSENGDFLFVTLSGEFLGTEAPAGGAAEADAEQNLKKQLGVYAIVNTLIEMGGYSRIQILIDDGSGRGQKIKRSEAGFTDDPELPLEPLGREGGIILTPKNTLKTLLEAYQKKDWQQVYGFLAETDAGGEAKPPDVDAFILDMTDNNILLENFDIFDANVSPDGQSAIVMMDYTVMTNEGDSFERVDIPAILYRENNLWKVSYTALERILVND